MATLLITFLGRVPKKEGAYRETIYQFEDGEPIKSAFFGWPLCERLQPDKVLILGTKGSMWDHLFEGDLDFEDEAEQRRLALLGAVENSQVEQKQLNALELPLSKKLNSDAKMEIIPYCKTTEEQADLLHVIAKHVKKGDKVHIDITHAYRHLPLVTLLTSLYLQILPGAVIEKIWYGFYNDETKTGAAWELQGLLQIAKWVEALASYEHTGDYGVFSDLLPVEIGRALKDAAFYEQINRIDKARNAAQIALNKIDKLGDNQQLFNSFKKELLKRLHWVKDGNYYERQIKLAYLRLDHGQYLEAVLLGYEAFITGLVQQKGLDLYDFSSRNLCRENYCKQEQKYSKNRSNTFKSWQKLRNLRNVLAHGQDTGWDEVIHAMKNHKTMDNFIRQLFNDLFNR